MELIFLTLTIIGVIVAIIFGFLQVIVPFVKGEVKFSKKYPFVRSVDAVRDSPRVSGKRRFQHQKSIVVLPLENLGKADDEYFAAGMAEEITSRLAAVSGLAVISRTSANQYAKTNKTIEQIGEELGVEYALEGTVRWARTRGSGDRVRVTSQLIRAASDTHLWAETYDRVLDDIFDIQSEIAQQVVVQLGTKILEREREALAKKPTDNIDAYHAYLQARYHATRPHFSIDHWQRVVDCAEYATQLDPGFVLAYLELVKAHSKFYFFWFDHTKERLTMAKRAVERAIELAPDSPQVHLASGLYHLWIYRDTKKALEELSRAEAGLPDSAAVIEAKAAVYEVQGRWDDALDAYKKAFALSPREASLPLSIGHSLWVSRHYQGAIEACEGAISLAPNEVWPYMIKAFIHWSWQGNNKGAKAALSSIHVEHIWVPWTWYWAEVFDRRFQDAIERLHTTTGEWIRLKICARPKVLLSAFAHGLMNEPEKARDEYELARTMLEKEAKQHPDDPRYHGSLGIVYAALGLKDKAIKEGKKAMKLLPITEDAFYGLPYVIDLAHIYTILGEHDAAVEWLGYLLSVPSWISVSWIQMDPRWDRLRDHPEFKKLLDKYSNLS